MKLIKVTQVYYDTKTNEFGFIKSARKERELYINPEHILGIVYDEDNGCYALWIINEENIYITPQSFESKLKEYLY